MCGRFALYDEIQKIKEQFKIEDVSDIGIGYNIPPSSQLLCIREKDGKRFAELMHWGLIPFWAKDKKISNKLINARAETINEKPAFKNAFKHNHCLVIMSGFFEWKATQNAKQPYYFKSPNNNLLAVASIWEEWEDKKSNNIIHSCCLVTTNANDVMNPIHSRMPLLIGKDDQNIWLKNNNLSLVHNILNTEPSVKLKRYAVTQKMNSPSFQRAEATEPQE